MKYVDIPQGLNGRLNGIDLFSGIGGITLALRDWVRPVAYCEIEPYCQSVLLSRMQEGDLPKAPIWDDIRTFQGSFWSRDVDIIYGGFPCQDISVAGHGKGLEGERSGLFFEIVRLAKEIKPSFLFLENVPAITTRGGLRVVREITEMGYDCRWCVISAASVGALHRRERWFLLAHSKSEGLERQRGITIGEEKKQPRTSFYGEDVAHSKSSGKRTSEYDNKEQSPDVKKWDNSQHKPSGHSEDDSNTDSLTSGEARIGSSTLRSSRETWGDDAAEYWPFESRVDWQEAVSNVCRTTDGLPSQVDRLKALGNAVVPQQVRKAFRILMGL